MFRKSIIIFISLGQTQHMDTCCHTHTCTHKTLTRQPTIFAADDLLQRRHLQDVLPEQADQAAANSHDVLPFRKRHLRHKHPMSPPTTNR